MKEFSRLHPLVSFIYFAVMIGFSMFLMHPFFLAASLFCALVCTAVLRGRALFKTLAVTLPIAILTAAVNPLFNHGGQTIITYFKSGNPLTLESLIFGAAAGVLLMCVMLWFSCFNAVMTADRLMCVFSRISPALSLTLSMILRFLPRFRSRLSELINAQKGIGRSLTSGSLASRMKSGIGIFSAMITWSLENAVDVSDSMHARGYGTGRRSAYSTFRFAKRDLFFLFATLAFAAFVFVKILLGSADFSYFPAISALKFDYVYIPYFLLGLLPAIYEIAEVIRWKSSELKI